MQLWLALLIWLIIVAIVFTIARVSRISNWSSAVLAIFIGYIFITWLISSGSTLNDGIWTILYIIILIGSPIILAIYIFQKALTDKLPKKNVK